MNNEATLRLGLVGLGWISPWHGQAARAAEGVELVACCDIREDRAESFAKEYGVERAFTDYRTMLREAELDAIILATWPTQHREQIYECIDAGVTNILCEKSLAFGKDAALDIWRAANEAEALVTEGFMWRHHPAVKKADALIAEGAIGEIDYIEALFDEYDAEAEAGDDPNRDWRKKTDAAGGVPWDLACYCIDASNHFAGSLPKQVMAISGTSPKYGTVNRLHALIEYENDRVAHVATSLKTDHNYAVKVNASEGNLTIPNYIRIDDASEVLVVRSREFFQWETEAFPIPKADPYQIQLERFVAAVRGGGSPYPSLAESIVDSLTLAAMLESGEQRETVAIEIPADVREAWDASAGRADANAGVK